MKKTKHTGIRSLAYIAGLLGGIIAIHFVTLAVVDTTCRQMLAYIDEIEAAIQTGGDTRQLAQDMEAYWQDRRDAWEIVTRHSEVEEIDTAIHRLKALLAGGASQTAHEALPELTELRYALEHVARNQHLTWVNIL